MLDSLRDKLAAFDDRLPLERARTIPASWYRDPEILDAERTRVFGRTWQAVGRLDQLRGHGDFLTTEIAGEPIVVVRDEEGILRAFANVCRHRAARVVESPCGRASRLRCRYHGWTYDLKGRLRGTPEFEGVAEFQREDHGLPPLAVDSWGPFVWVKLEAGSPTLREYLTPLEERLAGTGFERLQFVERREYSLACNWKVFVDNYLDGGYHVNTVHPGLAGVLDYSQYRTETNPFTSLQSSPLTPADGDAVASVRTGAMAYYAWIHPNFMLNVYDGVMDTNLVLPTGPETCRVIFDYYFADPDGPGRREYIAKSIAVAHQVQLEDEGVCEEVQRGLHSRTYDTGRFSVRREAAGYHFHQLLARGLKGEFGTDSR